MHQLIYALPIIALLFIGCDGSSPEIGNPLKEEISEETIEERADVDSPTFIEGENPLSAGKWTLVTELSDEFDGTILNDSKWTADPKFEYITAFGTVQDRGWYGSKRSLFEIDNVSVVGGELRIEAEKFEMNKYAPKDDRTQPAIRAYGGGKVRSKNLVYPGYYMEAEIKASSTVMSTAFWLITPSIPCVELFQQEALELDILECVGKMTGTTTDDWTNDDWAINTNWDKIFHSNVFRHPTQACFQGIWNEDKQVYEAERKGDMINLASRNSEAYHIYGCYWKDDGMDFYLDGRYVYSLENPGVAFQTPMNLIFSSNYYDWLKTEDAETGGFNDTKKNRSTKFKWVRTWKIGV